MLTFSLIFFFVFVLMLQLPTRFITTKGVTQLLSCWMSLLLFSRVECGLFCFVAYAGMACDLDSAAGKSCILQSPPLANNFNWTSMLLMYQILSQDVKLTLDLLVDGVPHTTYVLHDNQSLIWIPNPNVQSSITLLLEASRYLVSTSDYEYALVSSVDFVQYSISTRDSGDGRL